MFVRIAVLLVVASVAVFAHPRLDYQVLNYRVSYRWSETYCPPADDDNSTENAVNGQVWRYEEDCQESEVVERSLDLVCRPREDSEDKALSGLISSQIVSTNLIGSNANYIAINQIKLEVSLDASTPDAPRY